MDSLNENCKIINALAPHRQEMVHGSVKCGIAWIPKLNDSDLQEKYSSITVSVKGMSSP